jgi:hypothetical protein
VRICSLSLVGHQECSRSVATKPIAPGTTFADIDTSAVAAAIRRAHVDFGEQGWTASERDQLRCSRTVTIKPALDGPRRP